jgi:hypothetical protein
MASDDTLANALIGIMYISLPDSNVSGGVINTGSNYAHKCLNKAKASAL